MTTAAPDCVFTFCPNKQGLGTWADLTIDGQRSGAQPVCEQHWQALRFVPTKDDPSAVRSPS